MKKNISKKLFVSGILLLLLLSSFIPTIYGLKEEPDSQVQSSKITNNTPQNDVTITCHSFGMPGEQKQEALLPLNKAKEMYSKFEALQLEIVTNPNSIKAKQLQDEIIDFAEKYDLLPKGLSKDMIDSSPKQKKFFPLIKTSVTPSTQSKASEWFCTFVSAGYGSALPIIALPRLIPIIMVPIPRLFMRWKTQDAITSCGGLRSGTGFIAYGNQKGLALGFWGLGFTFSLPPVMGVYGLIGYSLYSTVDAEYIEYYPPNYPPEITAVYPLDNAEYIPISTSELSFHIYDANGELMSYSVTTNPNIGGGNGNLKPDGTYQVSINNLEGTEEYKWNVQVSDGENIVEKTFIFTTEPVAPIVSNPNPRDGNNYVSMNLTHLTFKLEDLQGDLMDYTIETSPDIGSGSGSNVGNGVYSIEVSGFNFTTDYKWHINVTDGTYWKHKQFSFRTEPKMVFDPFKEGWQKRKLLKINHSQIIGDLTNFPVLIDIQDIDLSENALPNGNDILFMDGEGVANRLFHEIEIYDSSNGELTAWVNIPELNNKSDFEFFMYYDNDASNEQQTPELVWDEHYVGIWHMNDRSNKVEDSTIYSHTGFENGNPQYEKEGKVGYSIEFNGMDSFIFTNPIRNDFPLTYEVWAKRNGENTDLCVMSNGGEYRHGFAVREIHEGDYHFEMRYGGNDHYRCYYLPNTNNNWNYFAGWWNGNSITNGYYYVNGVLYTSNPIDKKGNNEDYYFRIGCLHNDKDFWKGYIDEIRISDIEREFNWIETTYNMQNDPTNFIVLGDEDNL